MTDINCIIKKYRHYCESNNNCSEELNDNDNNSFQESPRPPRPPTNVIPKQNNYTELSVPRRIHKPREEKPPINNQIDAKEEGNRPHTKILVDAKEDNDDDDFDVMMKQHIRQQSTGASTRPRVTPNYYQNVNQRQNQMQNINNPVKKSIFRM